MTQKIIQIGNSTGIIIPKSVLDSLGLKPGSEVNLDTDISTHTLMIQDKKIASMGSSVNSHFLKIIDRVNKKYSSALQELAHK